MKKDPQLYIWSATGMCAVASWRLGYDPAFVRLEDCKEMVQARDSKVAKFLLRGIIAGCIIIPARVYSRYAEDGSLHDEDYVGIRYAAMPYDTPNILLSEREELFHPEEVLGSNGRWYDTPKEALDAWKEGAAAREEAFQRKMKPECANPSPDESRPQNVSTSS